MLRSQLHNIIRDELANAINAKQSAGDQWLAATEVASAAGRLDVVALNCCRGCIAHKRARIYEVKTTRSDLASWLKNETWTSLRELGADVWLIVPQSLSGALPETISEKVTVGVRLRTGTMSVRRCFDTVTGPPADDLVWSTLRAVRRDVRCGRLSAQCWDEANEDDVQTEAS